MTCIKKIINGSGLLNVALSITDLTIRKLLSTSLYLYLKKHPIATVLNKYFVLIGQFWNTRTKNYTRKFYDSKHRF